MYTDEIDENKANKIKWKWKIWDFYLKIVKINVGHIKISSYLKKNWKQWKINFLKKLKCAFWAKMIFLIHLLTEFGHGPVEKNDQLNFRNF